MNKFWTKRIETIHEETVMWIKNFFNGTNRKAIIGISGGTDSSVAAALCVEALGKENVIGIKMPQGTQHDIWYSDQLIKHLDIESHEINILDIYDQFDSSLCEALNYINPEDYPVHKTNTPARIRMTLLYSVAAIVGGFVVNTCNRSENYIGYSTKFGDHAGDFSPLWNLTKTEIKMLGHLIGLPTELVEKPPEDGLSGKTDEDNIGFSYDTLDKYILFGLPPETDEELRKIESMHNTSRHKMEPMYAYEPEEINDIRMGTTRIR